MIARARSLACRLGLASAMAVACGPRARRQTTPAPAVDPAEQRGPGGPVHSRATIPREAGAFGPTLAGGGRVGALLDDDACADCHPDVAAQWGASAHAWASMSNPIYRVSLDGFREARGRATSAFCGGCHDPALLVDGAMAGPIDSTDPRAHAGVGCRTCHGIVDATLEGNASYTLGGAPLQTPDLDDAASIAAHRRDVAGSGLRSANLCVSCHRGAVGSQTGHAHALRGVDDATAWLGSAFAGAATIVDEPQPRRDCGGCHMGREPASRGDVAAAADGTVASHRFAGGHTWLAAMLGDEAQLEAQRAQLVGAVRAAIAGVRVGADTVSLDVVVRNTDVAHRFPGGTRDAQDTWIDVAISDERGLLARTSDADTHRLRALAVDERGVPVEDRDVAAIHSVLADHTIPPRQARLSRHRAALARPPTFPLRIVARVLHRSRAAPLAAAACEATRSERGRAFAAAAPRALDPCAPQPRTEVARAVLAVSGPAIEEDWRTAFEHGLALVHDVQEHAGSADAALAYAQARAPDSARAQILAARADVAIRQTRVADALDLADQIEAETGQQPALAWLRGRAHEAAWDFEAARPELESATRGLPTVAAVWAALAGACGSLGDAACSLRAAQRGLRVSPRVPALLRAQALALEEVGAPEQADPAAAAYLRYRGPDDPTPLRDACIAADPTCARELTPIHVHHLATD